MTPHEWTPTLDKMIALRNTPREGRGPAAEVQDFLDWLLDEFRFQDNDEYRIVLATYVQGKGIYSEQPTEIRVSREELLAKFFGIDLAQAERERMAVLEWVRSQ